MLAGFSTVPLFTEFKEITSLACLLYVCSKEQTIHKRKVQGEREGKERERWGIKITLPLFFSIALVQR